MRKLSSTQQLCSFFILLIAYPCYLNVVTKELFVNWFYISKREKETQNLKVTFQGHETEEDRCRVRTQAVWPLAEQCFFSGTILTLIQHWDSSEEIMVSGSEVQNKMKCRRHKGSWGKFKNHSGSIHLCIDPCKKYQASIMGLSPY